MNKTVTVKPAGQGGTYTSLAAAKAGELVANPNLVSMAGILTISIEGDWSATTDTTGVYVTGFTTSVLYYVNIITDTANKAGTSWSTSKYRIYNSATWDYGLQINQDYTRVTGVQVTGNASYNEGLVIIQSSFTRIDSLFVLGTSHCQTQGLADSRGSNRIANCIIKNIPSGGVLLNHLSVLYNCIVAGCSGIGVSFSGGSGVSQTIKNSYSGGNGGADYGPAGLATQTFVTCYSEDGTRSTSTAAYSTATFTNVTSGSEDFSLPTGSALIGVGTDLSADSTYPFNWDINRDTRTVPWDVGAVKYTNSVSGNILYSGVTNVNGEITFQYNYTANQTITGKVRKSSTPTYYKTGQIAAVIKNTGLNLTIFMRRDM